MKKKIIDKEIIRDIARGMANSELLQKYKLTTDQLLSIFQQLAETRAKRIQALAGDLKSGMAPSKLMKKYQLSSEAFSSSLKRLYKANAITSAELEVYNSYNGSRISGGSLRTQLRNLPIPVVTICEVGKPGTKYLVRDISENGIGVTGIRAEVDEMKFLAVVGDEFGEIAPFEFEAQCRWARELEPDGATCAGFRITKISDQDVLRLREFLQGFTFWIEET